MSVPAPWLEQMREAARVAETAEASYRADFARRVAELAETRAVAHRRVNLMAALAESVAPCESEPQAEAHGLATLRSRLGWSSETEARSEILNRFAPVARAIFEAARPEAGPDAEDEPDRAPPADPAEALVAFEAWYGEARGSSFWLLFENVMRETPLVDW